MTERFADHENERFRDLIDLIICRDLIADFVTVREACADTFEVRGTHAWPPRLIISGAWAEPYAALAGEMGFPVIAVDEAAEQVRQLIATIDAARVPPLALSHPLP